MVASEYREQVVRALRQLSIIRVLQEAESSTRLTSRLGEQSCGSDFHKFCDL